MRKYILMAAALALGVCGCDAPKVSGSTAPLSDEERRKVAEEDKRTTDDEGGPRDAKGRPVKR